MSKTLNDLTREFLMNEGSTKEASLKAYIQALEENLLKFEARSNTEARRLEVMKEQLRGIRRNARRLEEQLHLLESKNIELQEQLNLLQEKKDNVENG